MLVRGSSSPPSREEHHPPLSHTREATPPSGLGPLPERPRPGLWARPRGASSPSSPRILAGTMNPPPDSSTRVSYSFPPPPPLPTTFTCTFPPSPAALSASPAVSERPREPPQLFVSWAPQAALQPRHAVGSRPPPVLLLLGASLCS